MKILPCIRTARRRCRPSVFQSGVQSGEGKEKVIHAPPESLRMVAPHDDKRAEWGAVLIKLAVAAAAWLFVLWLAGKQ